METLTVILSAVLGGSLCAFVLHIATKRNERMALTLTIIEQKDDLIEKIENSFDVLKYDLDLDGKVFVPSSSKAIDAIDIKQKFDTVIIVGDFLNRVAFLYFSWKINYKIIRNDELYNILVIFVYLLLKNNFKIQIYDYKGSQPSDDYIYKDWRTGWPFLCDFLECRECRFMKNEKYQWKQFFEIFL